jgi:hypothetical protein
LFRQQEHLIWKLSILTEANQDRFGALLLAHQGQEYSDELAFTVAYLSRTVLTKIPKLLAANISFSHGFLLKLWFLS